MKRRLFLIPIILNCFCAFGHPKEIEKGLESYLDSVIEMNDLTYAILESEMIHYAKVNYKKLKSIEDITLFLTTKLNERDKQFSPNYLFELKHLKLLSYYTKPVVGDLKKMNRKLIQKHNLWADNHLLTKLYVFLHELSYWKLDCYKPNQLGTKLLMLYQSTDNKSFINKLVIFALVDKIYNANKYVKRALITESKQHGIKVIKTDTSNKQPLSNESKKTPYSLPTFPGGDLQLRQYIYDNFEYPRKAKEKNIQGKVNVSFIINSNGLVSDIKIIHSAYDILSKEAIRIVASMPPWKPGHDQHNNYAPIKMSLPVEFALDGKLKVKPNPLSSYCIIADY